MPTEITVDLPSLTIAALQWGPDDGPLALCLHGFPDSAWTWRHLGPVLADQGWRVVAPFTRGYAPTGPAPDGDYRVGALITDGLELTRELSGDRRAVLIGHDWGAATVHGMAAHAPEAFDGVVSMAVPPVAALRDTLMRDLRAAGGQAARSWYIAFNQLPLAPERAFEPLVRLLWRRWSPGYDATEDLVHLWRALPDRAHRKAALTYYRHLARPLRRVARNNAAHADWMKSPRVRTLYLQGETDGCVSPAHVDRVPRRLPPGSETELVADGGHFLHLERPDFVNKRIAEFLSG